MDKIAEWNIRNCQTPRREYREKSRCSGNDFLDMTPKAQATKAQIKGTSNQKTSVQQRKQSTKGKSNLRTAKKNCKPHI